MGAARSKKKAEEAEADANNAAEDTPMTGPKVQEPIPASERMKTTYYGVGQNEFDTKHGRIKHTHWTIQRVLASVKDKCTCTKERCENAVTSKLPFIKMVRHYKFKQYILGDLVSGLSLGVVQIPLSMGFSIMAALPPIIGLYTSFFPPLIYFFFGVSQYVSMGSMALNSLVIASAVDKGTARYQEAHSLSDEAIVAANIPPGDGGGAVNGTSGMNASQLFSFTDSNGNISMVSGSELYYWLLTEKYSINISMSFLCGLLLIGMSLFGLSFWAYYISDQFISGYITGANIQVLTHQIKLMLGVTVGSYTGPLSYFKMLRDILLDLPNANVATIIMSVISCILLIVVKKCVNQRFRDKLKVPIPIDLVVVAIGTLMSYYWNMEERFGVRIVKKIPQGLPAPMVPSITHMYQYVVESLVLALMGYVLVFMMVKMFSHRYNHPYDATQEMFATGMSSCGSAFFLAMAPSTSPPRCFLMEATGGRTQVCHVVSAFLVLLTLYLVAPILEPLPIGILGCLILVSCIPLFEHYKKCVYYWKTCKYDFSIWLVSMVTTLTLGVDLGMFIGVGFSFLVTVYRTQQPYVSSMAIDEKDGVLLDGEQYTSSTIHLVPGVHIYRFESPLYFATIDLFKEKLFAATINPASLIAKKKALAKQEALKEKEDAKTASNDAAKVSIVIKDEEDKPLTPTKSPKTKQKDMVDAMPDGTALDVPVHVVEHNTPLTPRKRVNSLSDDTEAEKEELHSIIIDMTVIPFLDTSGACLLAFLYNEYGRAGVQFALAGVSHSVSSELHRVAVCKELVENAIYPSPHDAIVVLKHTHAQNASDGLAFSFV